MRHLALVACLAAGALLVTSCTCDSAPEEPVNRNGISEGHMPPELPPMPAPSSTSTARAATKDAGPPSKMKIASYGGDFAELSWTTPPGWRFLGAPSLGPVRAHFFALEDGDERVDVYITHLVATRGATPEARLKDAIERESDGFARVESKDVTHRPWQKQTASVVEIHGVRREQGENGTVKELPGRTQLSVLIPTGGVPLRVGLDGRRDLVERVRDDFLMFTDALSTGAR